MGKKTTKVPYETLRYHLGEWGLELFLVKLPNMTDPKECWFSVRPLCDQMGLDAPNQRDRIRNDHRFDGYWHMLPVDTDAGERESLCLRIEKIGTWFTIISPLKMNERYRGKLQAVQATIERKAAEAVLGEAAKHLLPPHPQDKLVSVARGEWHFHCPNCAAALKMVSDGTHPPQVVVGKEF